MIKKLLSLFVGIALTLFASLAHAMPPQNGWWWNPSESGSGYAIERQGNSIFMASFLYESSGAATWYVSSLTLGPDGSYQGDMLRYTGGKSLLGSYKPPTSPTVVAKVAISFKYADTGTMVISFPNGAPSRTITIYRFGFGTPTAFAPSNGSFQSGWYWNAAESGTGYFVEVQGNQAFIASFMYDTAGQPTWYVSVANLQGSNGLSGSLTKYINGQSVGGTYRAPTISGDAGVVSYNFGTGSSGTMKLPNGASVPITRFGFDSTYTTNTPPIANAGSNQSVTVGTRVSLNGSGTDSNGDNLNYYWSYLAAPANSEASLYNWTTANPYFTPDQTGTYQFGLTVDDGKASSSLALVTINAINTNTSSNGCAPATYTPNLPPMIDSLGNPVDESFGGGDAGAVGADGTAGDGAPIANAPVTITDANGKTVSTTTDALGYYRVSLKCMTAPFIAKVTRADGNVWYSASTTSPIQRGFVTMNLTGLTDKTVGYVADAAKLDGRADIVTPAILASNASSFVAAKDKIAIGLSSLLTTTGLNSATFDPVVTPYKAILDDKYDKLLEQLILNKNPERGNTVVVGTLAGAGQTLKNGVGSNAAFFWPSGIALDRSGNIFVVDSRNHAIRKITPAGLVTTFAGGKKGFTDGIGTSATFNDPNAIGIDNNDNLYVADYYNHAIRKITPLGVVTTLAGGKEGSIDGIGSAAGFYYPSYLKVDADGNIFVVENKAIRKITPSGLTSTLALISVSRIGIDFNGNIFAYDFNNKSIIKLSPAGSMTVIKNGVSDLRGIAIDMTGNIYASSDNSIIKIMPSGDVVSIAGNGKSRGFFDGLGANSKFNYPTDIALDKLGNLYISDTFNNAIRKITPSGFVSTIAGSGPTDGFVDGVGTSARFYNPKGIVVDGNGNTYVADQSNSAIRKIKFDGTVSTHSIIGMPFGLAIDSIGNLYVGSSYNSVYKITPSGVSTLLAGKREGGFIDGVGSAAAFSGTDGLAIDSKSNIFVADVYNHAIRKITPSGVVTTFAGGKQGFNDGVGTAATFYRPTGLAVDSNDNLYVADAFNQAIRKISPSGVVTTFAGGSLGLGFKDGIGKSASFNNPSALAIDKKGNLYVADTFNAAIRKITPSAVVTTVAGDGTDGYKNDAGTGARFNSPRGIAVVGEDTLLVTDSLNNVIRIILP